jgi:hypothetical protein
MKQANILKNGLWLLNNLKFSLMAATLCCCHFFSYAQNRNSVWCFGDSALIDFSDTSNIIVGSCGLDTRGSCASIANENGKLLFYAETRATISGNTTLVFDTTHQVMQNGNNIVGRGWYQELVIVPNPANDSTYYLFSIGVTSIYGLYYSIIDMRLNNGLGAVTVKNVQLQSFEQVDCLNAVKHGNGRDWWVLFRKAGSLSNGNNDWYSYLITPVSVQNFSIQSIGSLNKTNSGYTNLIGLVELYDFDRCSGLLSNPVTIEPEALPSVPYTWSCEFSPDASKLYVTTADDTTYLFQYDLNASNISQSKNTLWTTNYPLYTGGGLKLAPDNKIYLASIYYNGVQFPYPYQDTVYNMYNMNLSVINQPDSLGIACDFQPYSFYLGGKRTYVGLPNNPDYDLGVVAGSACDTITGIAPSPLERGGVRLYPNPVNNTLFITGLSDASNELVVYDIYGRLIIKKQTNDTNSSIDVSSLSDGVYNLRIKNETGEYFKKRFVVIK